MFDPKKCGCYYVQAKWAIVRDMWARPPQKLDGRGQPKAGWHKLFAIKQNLFMPQIFLDEYFLRPTIFLDQKFFWIKHFFGSNIFWTKNFFGPKFLLPQIIFRTKIFPEPKFLYDPKNFMKPKLYLNQKKFMNRIFF